MLFSRNSYEEIYLEEIFSRMNKRERGKIDKIQKHYKESLRQLHGITDKHTLSICVNSVHDYHIRWVRHSFGGIIGPRKPLERLFFKWKKNFLESKGMI